LTIIIGEGYSVGNHKITKGKIYWKKYRSFLKGNVKFIQFIFVAWFQASFELGILFVSLLNNIQLNT